MESVFSVEKLATPLEQRKDIIQVKGLNKWYGDHHVLKDVDLQVKQGEVIVVLGPSGSGKSTFIRTINALEEFQKGSIIVDNIALTDDLRNIEEIRKETGMVFQSDRKSVV